MLQFIYKHKEDLAYYIVTYKYQNEPFDQKICHSIVGQ